MEEKISEKLNSILNELDYKDLFILSVVQKGVGQGSGSIKVFVDGEKGVSIDQCARISKVFAPWVEEEGFFTGRYNLEVSSPGADMPLVDKRQFPKHVGRKLSLELKNGSHLEGSLENVEETGIKLNSKGEKRDYSFEEIEKAKVLISI